MNKFESKYYNTAVRMDEAFLELLGSKEFEYITVKELCTKAKVNRSTFYLHYESINDLLLEVYEYVIQKFASYFQEVNEVQNISEMEIDTLFLITPEYLKPWLLFIRENTKLFRIILNRNTLLGAKLNTSNIVEQIIYPILNRYHIDPIDQEYILYYYVEGVIAIVKVWIRNNCKRDIDEIVNLITGCVGYQRRNDEIDNTTTKTDY